ncbi:DUF2637 domain-containing protein [Nocardiopsis tropica]|uniref:DUF2637 domain-containing protein n=1 Tax=Nocardiopsis tropica TaxID=109330 RepID=UPI002E885A8B|nr:DUF2637 domain-containing protein [Nocardiopsis tropica]
MRRALSASADWGPILVLAGIAAAGSFTHIRDLAEKSGQHGWMAWAIAVSIDLTCVMAARERQRDATRKTAEGVLTWPTVVLFGAVILTLAANLATAQPTVWGWIMAAVPAAAFLVAMSMLERRAAHRVPAPDQNPDTVESPEPSEERDEFRVTEVRWQQTETVPAPEPPPVPVSSPPEPAPAAVEQGHPLAPFAAQLAQDYRITHGHEITVTALRSRLGVSETVAASLREQITS